MMLFHRCLVPRTGKERGKDDFYLCWAVVSEPDRDGGVLHHVFEDAGHGVPE